MVTRRRGRCDDRQCPALGHKRTLSNIVPISAVLRPTTEPILQARHNEPNLISARGDSIEFIDENGRGSGCGRDSQRISEDDPAPKLRNEPNLIANRQNYPSAGGASCSRLGSKRINDLQKRELMEIRITGADLPNAMFAHENCRMRVMQQITGQMR
jgi:hypothetical protein